MLKEIDIIIITLIITVIANSQNCTSQCTHCFFDNSSSQYKCDTCIAQYYIQNGQCKTCSSCSQNSNCSNCTAAATDTTTLPTQLPLVFSIIVAALFFIIFGCCLYNRCRRRSFNIARDNISSIRESVISSSNLMRPIAQDWKKDNNPINSTETCSICLDHFMDLRTECGHIYHAMCLWKWVSQKAGSCPLCKRRVPSNVHVYCIGCFNYSFIIPLNQLRRLTNDQSGRICPNCLVS